MEPMTTAALIGVGSSLVSGYLKGKSAEEMRKEEKEEREKDRKLRRDMTQYQHLTQRPQQMGNVVNQMMPAIQQSERQRMVRQAQGL